MRVEIKNRWNEATLYSGEHVDVKEAVEAAVKAGADLTGADLSGADLSGADLTGADLTGAYLVRANLNGADLSGADLTGAYLVRARLADAKVGAGEYWARLAGPRPIVQIGPIGSRNDWLLVFWCGDAGVRISAGCHKQITESYFLQCLADRHGEGEQANIHAQHYIEALAFAKRLLKYQQDGALSVAAGR